MDTFFYILWAFLIVVAIAAYAEDHEYEIDWLQLAVIVLLAPFWLAGREIFKRFPGNWV